MLTPARRRLQTSAISSIQKQLPPTYQPYHPSQPAQNGRGNDTFSVRADTQQHSHVKRNEMGVQMLSRPLHAQIFRNTHFPKPSREAVAIAREHLHKHGLDPEQSSVLSNTSFTLPPLLGRNLDQHFHILGAQAAEPYRSLAVDFANASIPPQPEPHEWEIRSGWTKYHYLPNGMSYSEHVGYPHADAVVFDVETMPEYHNYPVMACAVTVDAWYAWISPWLLGETPDDPAHLIPLGPPSKHRVVIGHNVSYDRARIREEYGLQGTRNRFIDTMSLHVAVKGMSSHQRPAWMKHRKEQEVEQQQCAEAMAAIEALPEEKREELQACLKTRSTEDESSVEASLFVIEDDEDDAAAKTWQDVTSANSLRDVAKLHCGIEIDKEIRSDFMTRTPAEIREGIVDYLTYCATDVATTHAVYQKVLPIFMHGCPHPASFAGVLEMGSGFLPVDENWEMYLKNAEEMYLKMEANVRGKLRQLAEEAKSKMESGTWKDDVWLSQIDWQPKVAGPSRGVYPQPPTESIVSKDSVPAWYWTVQQDPFCTKSLDQIVPLLLNLACSGHPLKYNSKDRWHYTDERDEIKQLPTASQGRAGKVLGRKHAGKMFANGSMSAGRGGSLAPGLATGSRDDDTRARLLRLAEEIKESHASSFADDPWLSQLDWRPVDPQSGKARKPEKVKPPPVLWPKWYWDIAKPRKDVSPGTPDLTVRNRLAPLLLKLSWMGFPLFYSREHGWVYRVPPCPSENSIQPPLHSRPLAFYDAADEPLSDATLRGFSFYKLPHKDGESANVGSPLTKTFMKYASDGILRSPGDEAKEALDLNAMCSYWISARDRILNQMVVWEDRNMDLGFPRVADANKKWGVIVPQVISMGTVTRRAIEKTWLTASNAKQTRVGSELKAMVRAPPGYAIVGADVDSEELWISSCMGDAQFGIHGSTALGWMTLEGTKSAGTDLHSKTASILGISRNQAKQFNYARIYGAGMRHSMQLLTQANPGIKPEEVRKLTETLYASTKGKNTHRNDIFGRKFWFGGSESYVFNKLEAIASSARPQTPALGCGVTDALVREYLPEGFGSDYLPSRINWVVQSSGVDYLHLLIVSMNHLIRTYDIRARYLISVHDEVRYLVEEQDRYRAALALQIANLWTRSLFAYKLGMDDLPQGVAFFSAVDVDRVLRKEVDMPCVTPSQPHPIPPGESLDIVKVLEKTNNGSLWPDGRSMDEASVGDDWSDALAGYKEPDCLAHRAPSIPFLKAQVTTEFNEIKKLAKQYTGQTVEGGIGDRKPARSNKKAKATRGKARLGNGDVDWTDTFDKILADF